MKMEEKNYDRLQRKLADLPVHEPSEKVWNAIDRALENDATFSRQLKSLPQYNPKNSVWQNIENQLVEPKKSNLVLFVSNFKKIAATVVFLAGVFWFFTKNKAPETTLSYSTEAVQHELQIAPEASDEDAFQMVKTICSEKFYLCESPDFQLLKVELDELDAAKNSLESAIGDYNTNPDLMAELTQIELDRTEVLKKMLVYL